MSENWINIIFEKPTFIPSKEIQERIEKYVKTIIGKYDQIISTENETIQFFDAGSNFEKIFCPNCEQVLEIDWWHNIMSNDYSAKGFTLTEFELPCCKNKTNINNLNYYFPQGFGKFILEIRNPENNEINPEQKNEIEKICNEKIRIIYRHI